MTVLSDQPDQLGTLDLIESEPSAQHLDRLSILREPARRRLGDECSIEVRWDVAHMQGCHALDASKMASFRKQARRAVGLLGAAPYRRVRATSTAG